MVNSLYRGWRWQTWDLQTGRPLELPLNPGEFVLAASSTAEATRVLTVSSNAARLWDYNARRPMTGWLDHGDLVMTAEFSRRGRKLVTASLTDKAWLWDVERGQTPAQPLVESPMIADIQFSADEQK